MKFILTSLFFFTPLVSVASFHFNTDSIYDFDDRELVSLESSLQIQGLSKSVALIFNSNDLITVNNQLVIFANLLEDLPPVGINICPQERFASHHAYRNACSGFLVGPDLLVSAGHCFEDQYFCDNQLIAFDVDAASETPRGFKTNEKNIYHCKEIIAQVHDRESLQDYALIKLDRKSERAPLKMRTSGSLSLNDQVFLIGHPLGLPLNYTGASAIGENSQPNFFKARVDSFHGNSGSPIFNSQTQLVEGILVRGELDSEMDANRHCQKYIQYTPASGGDKYKGESITRIKFIEPFL
jgi:hypothetical protein